MHFSLCPVDSAAAVLRPHLEGANRPFTQMCGKRVKTQRVSTPLVLIASFLTFYSLITGSFQSLSCCLPGSLSLNLEGLLFSEN